MQLNLVFGGSQLGSTMFRSLIAWLDVRLSSQGPTWKDAARARGYWPVPSGWDWQYSVDLGGRVLRSENVDYSIVEEEDSPDVRHRVLAQASLEYPELTQLRPVRGPGDAECPGCSGSGSMTGRPRMICFCGGVGWIPQSYAASIQQAATEPVVAADAEPK